MRRSKALVIATVIVTLVAAVALTFSPIWPGPALPAGATRLHIATEGPHLMPALGCETALLGPVRVSSADDELTVLSLAKGERVEVVWPSGYAAWRLDGRAHLVARDGSVVARDGDVVQDRFEGGMGMDDAFHVCVIGS